jgi:hypothetical protein
MTPSWEMKALTVLAATERCTNAPRGSIDRAVGGWIKEIFEY